MLGTCPEPSTAAAAAVRTLAGWLPARWFTRDRVEVFDFRYFVPRSNLSHRGKVRRQLRHSVRQDRLEIFVCGAKYAAGSCDVRKWMYACGHVDAKMCVTQSCDV